MTARHGLIGVLVWVVGASLAAQAPTSNEDAARRHYEIGVEFLRAGRYAEALKDFQTVVQSYPTTRVAGRALVEIARFQLDVAHDVTLARAATDLVLRNYGATPDGAAGYVLSGRLAALGREPGAIDTALAAFERVPALFPASPEIPAAMYYAGETLRTVRRCDPALERFEELVAAYPASEWAVRGRLGAAPCLVESGRAPLAMEWLQQVRAIAPGSPEAALARRWNTILTRLYLRAGTDPAFRFTGRQLGGDDLRLRDVTAVTVDDSDAVYVTQESAIAVFNPDGSFRRMMAGQDGSGVAFAADGRPVIGRDGMLWPEGSSPIGLRVVESNGRPRTIAEIPDVVAAPMGEWIVADARERAVHRFAADGTFVATVLSAPVDALAVGPSGDMAVLDRRRRSVRVFTAAGVPLPGLPVGRDGCELDRPVDVAYDPLGQLYVLDHDRASVCVFSGTRLVADFSLPERAPGAFRSADAFAVDSAGRLYIYDDRAHGVLVYE